MKMSREMTERWEDYGYILKVEFTGFFEELTPPCPILAKCQTLPPPTCCRPTAFRLHLSPSYVRKISLLFSDSARKLAILSSISTCPFSFLEISHHLPHLEGWGEAADVSLLSGLVNLSDLHDPSPFTLIIYWP